jgi:hypothetical protein
VAVLLSVLWSATAYGGDVQQAVAPNHGETTYEAPGLAFVLGEDGSVKAVSSHGKRVPLLNTPGGFEVAEYEGAAQGARTLKPAAALTADGFVLSYDGGALTLAVKVEELPGHIALHGRLKKSTAPDRALIVSFALPVNAWGWNWWDDPSRIRRVEYGVEYANCGFLGEKRDIPISRMPFSAIAGNAAGAGLALAVPIDEPRIFRFNYSTERGLRVEFNLGLSSASMRWTRCGACVRRPKRTTGSFRRLTRGVSRGTASRRGGFRRRSCRRRTILRNGELPSGGRAPGRSNWTQGSCST